MKWIDLAMKRIDLAMGRIDLAMERIDLAFKRSHSLRFRHHNTIYISPLPHTCYMPHPPNNAAHNNDFFANLSDVASIPVTH
jgi:hypothetical protein